MKITFEKHGITEMIRSDSATRFLSEAWKEFQKHIGFGLETRSPYHHQANGQARSEVKNLNKCEDRHLGLLAYNATPKEIGYSSSQLPMGRHLRTHSFPIIDSIKTFKTE